MNRLFIYVGLIATILFTACYEDKGNMEYKPLSKVEVSGIESAYTLFLGDEWNLPVTLNYSLGEPDKVSYLWKVNGDTIAETKDLNTIVSFPLKEDMPSEFVVTDEITGVRTIFPFTVSVKSEFAQGWMILSDAGDHSELGYFRDKDGRFYENIYKTINETPLNKGAFALVEHFLSPFEPNVTEISGQIFIACTEGPDYSVDVDGDSFERVIYTKDEFVGAAPSDFMPETYESMPSAELGKGYDYLISNGKMYARALYDGLSYQDGLYVNFPYDYNNGDYRLVPTILRGNTVWCDYLVGYDEVSQSFVQFADGEVLTFDPMSDMAGSFSMVNTGLSWIDGGCVTIFNDVEGTFDTYVTFMKDASENVKAMKFQVWPKLFVGGMFVYITENMGQVKNEQGETVSFGGDIINEDSHFAYCDKGNRLYIATGRNLYTFNHNTFELNLLKTYDKTISEIGMNRLDQMELGIAFDNGDGTCDFGIADVSYIGGGSIKNNKFYTVNGDVKDILYKIGNQLLVSGML